ncbi:MAG: M18 family aminopeptidase [Actinomyces sp.]|nr:MAG: M18 family aminopeptidase [Actinomyces sp.]
MRPPDPAVARRLCGHIDASPSPYHAAAHAEEILVAAGFTPVDRRRPWPPGPGRRLWREGGALVAWIDGPDHGPATGFRIVGAHTDSPNLRVKPRPDTASAGWRQLGVEVYGGVLLNSWLDRDLGLSGRVSLAPGDGDPGVTTRLVRIDRPILRVPQLAIHLHREIDSEGLKLDRQRHLAPVWGLGAGDEGAFRRLLAAELDVDPGRILAWDVMTHDTAPSRLVGPDEEFVSAPRIDNLASCFCAVETLAALDPDAPRPHRPAVALFDHEEVGSVSATGAAAPLLVELLERTVAAAGGGTDELHRTRADTVVVSADGAHATHPNYAERHEPEHRIAVNAGPVLKVNANQRYASDAVTSAVFLTACERADVPHQVFVNRTDLACGSTIGPTTAATVGVGVVDAGIPQLAMHSAREFAGSHDPGWFAAVLAAFYED